MRDDREIMKKLDTADKTNSKSATPGFTWTFQRLGKLEQVVLKSADDLCHLDELDPKLWVALSCPASGLEFDSRTLNLIDTDRDGRIRIPEVVEAVQWVCHRLKDPACILAGEEKLSLDQIDDSTNEGKRLITTARALLGNLGKKDQDYLTQHDVSKSAAHASEQTFNGDGILPPLAELGEDMAAYIKDAMAVMGGVEDTGGMHGINEDISRQFMRTLSSWREWQSTVDQAVRPLGDKTRDAWELLSALKEKIDDYFLRCELAAYAPETRAALNSDKQHITPSGNGLLVTNALSDLPLAQVEADRPLDLTSGINPAWRDRVDDFAELIQPLLHTPGTLTRDDWRALQITFAPYALALASKPEVAGVAVAVAPAMSVDKLGDARIDELLASGLDKKFAKLAQYDADIPVAAADITEVERLVLYHKHLYRLLINFVSFEEFYTLCSKAAFQAGTLYIDGRSCRLCMPAEKVEEHSPLASVSQLYLLYCACTRGSKQDTHEPAKTMNIVAAVTAGDADLLRQSRNGVFVDNKGEDWDATVIKIVNNPISLGEAVLSPYKRIGNLITDQLSKYANDKQAAVITTAGQTASQLATTVVTPEPATTAPRFDISRNIGMFAAVGIALGAIGTAAGTIASALFAMNWWQIPVLLLGFFVIVSGPSVLLAWLKLRQRTLGPLLEASGWAINGRVAINHSLARRLTATAALPDNALRGRGNPQGPPSRWPWIALLLGIVIGAGLWLGIRSRQPYAKENRPAGAVITLIQPESITTSDGTVPGAAAEAASTAPAAAAPTETPPPAPSAETTPAAPAPPAAEPSPPAPAPSAPGTSGE